MIYTPEKHKIIEVFDETQYTKTFRVEYARKHYPGQFVQVSLPGYGECPISIASYNPKYLDLTIRNVGNLTQAIHGLKKGDYLYLRGPYGSGYPMIDLRGKDLVIIGGGTGVAPLRSVVEYVEAHPHEYRNVQIFLGFRNEERLLFRECIDKWCRCFETSVTLDTCTKSWKKDVGPVTTLLEKTKFNKERAIVLTCGPPVMIRFVVQSLKKKKFDDRQIYVSLERMMSCGVGKCGHCRIHKKYVCKDGPVFNYALRKDLVDE